MTIINVPMIFAAIWNIAKHFFDERVTNKITIQRSGWEAALLEQIDANQLPKIYGGECDYNPFGTFMGPWQNYEMVKPHGIKLKD